MNISHCGCQNYSKHIYINDGDDYITLDISLKFDSLDNTIITSSEPKDNLGRSGKGFITFLVLKAKARPKKCKKTRHDIGNISMKDILKIIRKFEKLTYNCFDSRRPKYETTDSKFYLARQLAKCMMTTDDINLDN